jgi:hypothetical protein
MKYRTVWVMTIVFTTALIMGCPNSSSSIKDIEGVWSTADKAYEGEFMEFTGNKVIMGSKDNESFTYTVTKVKTKKGHLYNSVLYIIHCTDESGQENLFNLLYTPQEGGSLRNKSSQDTVWTRSGKKE